MPVISVNDAQLYYNDQGTGDQTILFAHGLLWSGRMFSSQIDALQSQYRCISVDFRGHGNSEVTAGGYEIEQLTRDIIGLIESLALPSVHFVGLSMGGFVGMRIAISRPDLLSSLTLLNTSADIEAFANRCRYRLLTYLATWFGLRSVASLVMRVMFAPAFLDDPNRQTEHEFWRNELLSNQIAGVTRATKGVITRSGCLDRLPAIPVRTLVVAGSQDNAVPPKKGKAIAQRISDARYAELPDCGHSSTIEQSAAITTLLRDFVDGATANPQNWPAGTISVRAESA